MDDSIKTASMAAPRQYRRKRQDSIGVSTLITNRT